LHHIVFNWLINVAKHIILSMPHIFSVHLTLSIYHLL